MHKVKWRQAIMRAVVQRVSEAKVSSGNRVTGEIGKGLVVLLGIGNDDTEKDLTFLIDKIINLRIFEDDNDKMNISLVDISASLLVVSQFTLYGDCRKGKRPSFDKAARPETAEYLYNEFIKQCRSRGINVQTGIFQAMMNVEIHNDGPVTLLIDSRKEF
jgi:D-aminoacyl-tRNA deacylase